MRCLKIVIRGDMKFLDLSILFLNIIVLLIPLLNLDIPDVILIYGLCLLITIILILAGFISTFKIIFYIASLFIFGLSVEQTLANSTVIYDNFTILFSISGLILISFTSYLYYWLTPPLKFPITTGSYYVGVKNFFFKDFKRKEIHDQDFQYRELFIQFWYPSENVLGLNKSPYMPQVINFAQKTLGAKKNFIPVSIFDEFKYFTTNSVENAPIKEDKFPVLIFSHGLGSVCSLNTANIEELASHGYIVVGVNHTFSSYCTHLSDGKEIPCHDKFKIPLMKIIKEKLFGHVEFLECELKVWLDDVTFTLDELEKINNDKDSFFYQKLDLGNIGIFGHSFGGALSAEVCAKEKRIKAGASLDGAVSDELSNINLNKPFMFIVGLLLGQELYPSKEKLLHLKVTKEDWHQALEKYRKNIKRFCANIGSDAYYIVIQHAGHYGFTDISLLNPLITKYLKFDISDDNNLNIIKITNKYLLDFFDKYLKQKKIKIKNEISFLNKKDTIENAIKKGESKSPL